MTETGKNKADQALILAMPAVFVLLWSTGFIGARLGLPHAEPATFLMIRFAIVGLILGAVSVIMRAKWPRGWLTYLHLTLTGIMLHGLYLGGVFAAISVGVEAGTSALIVGVQPVLTAVLAGPLLGERLRGSQWFGLILGIGGVVLVVWDKLTAGIGTPFGVLLCVIALFGITLGTLYQKRFIADMDLRAGNTIQFIAATLFMALFAFTLESRDIAWTGEFLFALGWLIFVLSLGAMTLMFLLIRRGAASTFASLFFLVPVSTALIAWPLFGETFSLIAIGGMVLTAIGVWLVNRQG